MLTISVEARSTENYMTSRKATQSINWLGRPRAELARGWSPWRWLASGAPSIQLAAVGVGCALVTLFPTALQYRIPAIGIPLILLLAVHPDVQGGLLACCRRWFLRARSNARNGESESISLTPEQSSAAAKLYWSDNRIREATFLRSFDRFQEILREALRIQVGEIAEEFSFVDRLSHLEGTEFLTATDCAEWADCLAVRRSLFLADERAGPSILEVEEALASMLRLQVRLTDRLRTLTATEMRIRQQEDLDLQAFAGITDKD